MSDEFNKYLKEIARSLAYGFKLSTPFLFIDVNEISLALNMFKEYLPKVKLFYSIKANSSPFLIKILSNHGLRFDVASLDQITTALELGIISQNLFLSSPYKTPETLAGAIKANLRYMVVDSMGEVDRILEEVQNNNLEILPELFVRVRVDSKEVGINLNKKFGCYESEALSLINYISKLGFQVGGICFHVGTQSYLIENYGSGLILAMSIAIEANKRFNLDIRTINIGGGFCDPTYLRQKKVDIINYYKQLGSVCRSAEEAGFTLWAEPGRSIIANAGTSVSSVIGINIRDGTNWAYLDDGVYGNYSITLYEHPKFDFFQIKPYKECCKFSTNQESIWTLAGPTCCAIDIIDENVELTTLLQKGDMVISPNMGAYTTATACSFNGMSVPATYFVKTELVGGKIITELLDQEL